MCLQCLTDPISWEPQVLPGYWLHKATKTAYPGDDPEWVAGEWGLIHCNDPDLIWAGDLMETPADDAPHETWQKYHNIIADFEEALDCMAFWHSFRLSKSMIEAGYPGLEERYSYWLMDRLAKFVKTHDPIQDHPVPQAVPQVENG